MFNKSGKFIRFEPTLSQVESDGKRKVYITDDNGKTESYGFVSESTLRDFISEIKSFRAPYIYFDSVTNSTPGQLDEREWYYIRGYEMHENSEYKTTENLFPLDDFVRGDN
jgi:hypothetical protein